ncbi:MAG: cupin domain-containing protein [Halioglobus sp.]
MPSNATQLPLDWAHFLAHHWQRAPLLIPAALPHWAASETVPPIDANTLAGLALEPELESRLIETTDSGWHLLHGPFVATDFERSHPWTLLVQAVDHYLPEVAELKKMFSALPTWRMDDVMVSYATDGGSVGPHYDNYDVFLLQGEGHRRWRLGQRCGPESALIAHEELRILQDFECTEEFLLGPGDMLYVPPGVAHWGVAEGECTTLSIGFRAPSVEDLLSRRIDAQLEVLPQEQFYRDPYASIATRAGEIRDEDIARLNEQLAEHLQRFASAQWFGELVTEPRYDLAVDTQQVLAHAQRLALGANTVALAPEARVAWQALSSGQICVYANGQSRAFSCGVLTPLSTLCSGEALGALALEGSVQQSVKNDLPELLSWLLECGCLDVE